MFLVLWLMSCGGFGGANSGEPVAAEVYLDGMWEARALTVRAGLDEALELVAADQEEAAVELVLAVYQNSFEPELEPAVRGGVGAREAVVLELNFGLVRHAIETRTDPVEAVERLDGLLREAASRLDAQQATLAGS